MPSIFPSFRYGGGTLVVGYRSAVLDRDLHVRLGGHLGGAGSALQAARPSPGAPRSPTPSSCAPTRTGCSAA